jgi:hypothetical protein
MRISVWLLLTMLLSGNIEALPVRVYPLTAENPEQLLASIKQLYGDQAEVGLSGQQLVVRAEYQVLEDIAEVLAQLQLEPLALIVTLSAYPQQETTALQYATAGATPKALKVTAGKPLMLTQMRTRERPRAGGLLWVIVEDVPSYQNSLTIVPRVTGKAVTLDINYYHRSDNHHQQTRASLRGQLGDWIAIVNDAAALQADPAVRRFSSRSVAGGSLFIQVELAH